MKLFSYLPLMLFFVSCGSVRVNYDYDTDTDFSNYTTYNYYPNMDTGLSELDTQRLLRILDVEMQGKGLLLSQEPELLVDISSNSLPVPRNNTVGVGLGGSGRNIGGGLSIGIPVGGSRSERFVKFDFVDKEKDLLIWQANSKSTFKEGVAPVIRERKLLEIVQKVLSEYPPK